VQAEPSAARLESDASLIARSASRPEVFGAIFDRHFTAIHGYLSRRVGQSRADDLAASTFTVAFERRHSFRGEADSARPWLFGIATNLLRNERRSEWRALRALTRLDARPLTEPVWATGIDPRLAALLSQMEADQRDVLLLYAWGELSYDEIAASLGIPVGTVRSRLARAREHLRRTMADDELRPAQIRETRG
jgi:RNA polymerase sigma-70 factor (ECF subfamily)